MNYRFERGDPFIIFLGIVLFVLDKSKKTLINSHLSPPQSWKFSNRGHYMTPTQTRHYFFREIPQIYPTFAACLILPFTWEKFRVTPLLPLGRSPRGDQTQLGPWLPRDGFKPWQSCEKTCLVGGFNPTHLEKYYIVELDHFPKVSGWK